MITLHAASELLGIDDNTVYALAARGWLSAKRKRQHGRRLLSYSALARFASTPRCWLIAPPHTIPDPALRAVAQAAQDVTPGRWWASVALANRYHVHPATIGKWRRIEKWGGNAWEMWSSAWWLWAETPPPPPRRDLSAATLERKLRGSYATAD